LLFITYRVDTSLLAAGFLFSFEILTGGENGTLFLRVNGAVQCGRQKRAGEKYFLTYSRILPLE
jgi:hypothetical protein